MRPLTPVLYDYGTASPLPALPLALFGSDAAPSLSATGNAEPPPGHQPPGPAPPSVPIARGQAVTGRKGRPAGHAPFNQGGPSHARLPTTAPPDIAAPRSAQLEPRAAPAPEQPTHPWGAPQQYEWQRQTAATAPQRPAETPAQQWSQTFGHASGAPTRQHPVPDTARHPNHPIGIMDAVQPNGCHERHQPAANYTQADRSRRRRRLSTSAWPSHAPRPSPAASSSSPNNDGTETRLHRRRQRSSSSSPTPRRRCVRARRQTGLAGDARHRRSRSASTWSDSDSSTEHQRRRTRASSSDSPAPRRRRTAQREHTTNTHSSHSKKPVDPFTAFTHVPTTSNMPPPPPALGLPPRPRLAAKHTRRRRHFVAVADTLQPGEGMPTTVAGYVTKVAQILAHRTYHFPGAAGQYAMYVAWLLERSQNRSLPFVTSLDSQARTQIAQTPDTFLTPTVLQHYVLAADEKLEPPQQARGHRGSPHRGGRDER